MKVRFWGTRGSIPTPGPNTVIYGGNTSCVELRAADTLMCFDCGTGIREFGLSLLPPKKPLKVNILISHTHWDHIQGFPFFIPLYIPGTEIDVYGPMHHERTLEEIVTAQMEYSYFPVAAYQLAAKLRFHDMKEETVRVGDCSVTARFLNHPVFELGYRVEHGGQSFVYTGDNEPYYDFLNTPGVSGGGLDLAPEQVQKVVEDCNSRVAEFIRGVDVLVCDGQYTDEEYPTKVGWGHSTMQQAMNLAIRAGVKKCCLFHHEPTRGDTEMARLEQGLREEVKRRGLGNFEVLMAREGMEIEW